MVVGVPGLLDGVDLDKNNFSFFFKKKTYSKN